MNPAAIARFFLPSPPMGGCIFAAVERDTRGACLSDAQRFNYYPATPMFLISWIFEGELHMVAEAGAESGRYRLDSALPRLVFSGPQRRPRASWSPDAVHALSVAFYPDALAQLVGKPIEPFIDTILPASAVLGADLLAACEALFERAAAPALLNEIEGLFRPFWAGAHARSTAPLLGEWLRALATRAAFSKAGCGARQLQRRIKSWAGQSYRDLQIFARVETAFVHSGCSESSAEDSLSALALSAGFADQSHMGREVRRITGIPPGRFLQLVATDEAFWFYRLIEGQLRTIDAHRL